MLLKERHSDAFSLLETMLFSVHFLLITQQSYHLCKKGSVVPSPPLRKLRLREDKQLAHWRAGSRGQTACCLPRTSLQRRARSQSHSSISFSFIPAFKQRHGVGPTASTGTQIMRHEALPQQQQPRHWGPHYIFRALLKLLPDRPVALDSCYAFRREFNRELLGTKVSAHRHTKSWVEPE